MDLSELNTLKSEWDEIESKIETSKKETEEKINELNSLKKEIEEKISKILGESKTKEEKLFKEQSRIAEKLYYECRKLDIYGTFNIKEIGEVLAELASSITGVDFHYEIYEDKKMGSTCIRNHGINFKRDIAGLVVSNGEITPSWNLCYAEASDPTEKDDICYMSDGYGGYGTCEKRTFNECEQLTSYNSTKKSFRFIKLMKNQTLDFISDYLVYVSNYRLENNLVMISKDELQKLKEEFLNKYVQKYTKYKEEKKKLDEYIEKRKREEERKLKEKEAIEARQKFLEENPNLRRLYSPFNRNRRNYR